MWLCFCTYSSFSCLSFFRSNSYFLLYSSAISFEYFSNLILYPSPTLILILCASNSLNNSIYFLNFCSNSNSSFFLSNTLFLLMFYFCIKFMRYSWSTIISFCSNVQPISYAFVWISTLCKVLEEKGLFLRKMYSKRDSSGFIDCWLKVSSSISSFRDI